MERAHFRDCMSGYSACKCHYDSRREEGEYYERSKSTASRSSVMLESVMLGELLPIISIINYFEWAVRILTRVRAKEEFYDVFID